MNKLFPFFILLFAFSVSGQSLQDKIKTFEHRNAYKVEYDQTKNHTRVQFGELPVERTAETESPVSTIFLGASFSFEGDSIAEDVGEFNLYFQSFCPTWCFQQNHSLSFFTGIEKIDLGEGMFNGKVGRGHGKDVTETIVYKISRADLASIADAGVSEFKLGDFESVLNDSHKRMLKNILDLGTCR